MVERTPSHSGDDGIAQLIETLEQQLLKLDNQNLNIAAAHLDAAIQQLRTDAVSRRFSL